MEQKDSRFAVLIDADNVSPKYIKYIPVSYTHLTLPTKA